MMPLRRHDAVFNRIRLVPRPAWADLLGPCWRWQGSHDYNGYPIGTWSDNPRGVHRYVYEQFRGKVPAHLQMDHLCRVRDCCNPNHLEPVTREENRRRGLVNQNKYKTHCQHGHLLEGDNLYVYRGKRHCRECRRVWGRRRWATHNDLMVEQQRRRRAAKKRGA